MDELRLRNCVWQPDHQHWVRSQQVFGPGGLEVGGGTRQNSSGFSCLRGIPAVTKSSSFQHLQEDLDLWSWNLEAKEMQQLDAHKTPRGSPSFACNAQAMLV